LSQPGGVLTGRRIVLGVCGGIAAYKSVDLCRRMIDHGAEVAPVLTADATRFVGPVTFSALASQPARTSLWDGADPLPHIRLAQWADLVVVAPATARLMGAYAAGLSDDLLTATLLATRAQVLLCPAMHSEMWEHPAVQHNVAVLKGRGVTTVGPAVGRLAGGDVGVGRLAEVDEVLAAAYQALAGRRDLAGARVLVTAGGTREALDPVRYLANRSSGKQGHALADEASARGAAVILVTTTDRAAAPGVSVVRVETAADMEEAVLAEVDGVDIVIMAAAVADFRPKVVSDQKLKRSEGVPDIVLEPTSDILGALANRRREGQLLVGFAAETGEPREAALAKLRAKRLDLIVANDVSAPESGFGHDTNAVLLLGADGTEKSMGLADKREVARVVIDTIVAMRGAM
jgi:phosphopantothenoylcysteine decarboxylase/phosphopantothenate--cysteine ligase